ncbi:MAG: hypothetical protein AAFR55_03235 [Pseudomonadota bacterium]
MTKFAGGTAGAAGAGGLNGILDQFTDVNRIDSDRPDGRAELIGQAAAGPASVVRDVHARRPAAPPAPDTAPPNAAMRHGFDLPTREQTAPNTARPSRTPRSLTDPLAAPRLLTDRISDLTPAAFDTAASPTELPRTVADLGPPPPTPADLGPSIATRAPEPPVADCDAPQPETHQAERPARGAERRGSSALMLTHEPDVPHAPPSRHDAMAIASDTNARAIDFDQLRASMPAAPTAEARTLHAGADAGDDPEAYAMMAQQLARRARTVRRGAIALGFTSLLCGGAAIAYIAQSDFVDVRASEADASSNSGPRIVYGAGLLPPAGGEQAHKPAPAVTGGRSLAFAGSGLNGPEPKATQPVAPAESAASDEPATAIRVSSDPRTAAAQGQSIIRPLVPVDPVAVATQFGAVEIPASDKGLRLYFDTRSLNAPLANPVHQATFDLVVPGDAVEGALFPLRIEPRHRLGELSAILLSGLPDGIVLSAGTRLNATSWGLLPSQLDDLRIWLPSHVASTLDVSVQVFQPNGLLAGQSQLRIRRAEYYPASGPLPWPNGHRGATQTMAATEGNVAVHPIKSANLGGPATVTIVTAPMRTNTAYQSETTAPATAITAPPLPAPASARARRAVQDVRRAVAAERARQRAAASRAAAAGRPAERVIKPATAAEEAQTAAVPAATDGPANVAADAKRPKTAPKPRYALGRAPSKPRASKIDMGTAIYATTPRWARKAFLPAD